MVAVSGHGAYGEGSVNITVKEGRGNAVTEKLTKLEITLKLSASSH